MGVVNRLIVVTMVQCTSVLSALCTGFSTCTCRFEVPEQALGGIPLDLGIVVKINLVNFTYKCIISRWA